MESPNPPLPAPLIKVEAWLDFFREDLQGSRFERVDLSGAQFRTVDMSGATFRGVYLQGVNAGSC